MKAIENILLTMIGTPAEKQRRQEMLRALLQAFQRGGPQAATAFLERQGTDLERLVGEALEALRRQL
jgi:hypothetical protein